MVEEVGFSHNKEFIVNVVLENKIIGKGSGKNKKDAEQCAAKDALKTDLFFL